MTEKRLRKRATCNNSTTVFAAELLIVKKKMHSAILDEWMWLCKWAWSQFSSISPPSSEKLSTPLLCVQHWVLEHRISGNIIWWGAIIASLFLPNYIYLFQLIILSWQCTMYVLYFVTVVQMWETYRDNYIISFLLQLKFLVTLFRWD